MPSKRPRTKDIRSFFENKKEDPGSSTGRRPLGGAAASQVFTGCQGKVKVENGFDGGHLHRFTLKFNRSDRKEYTVDCHQPCTVLEAIKSTEMYKEKIKCADENIVIQMGKEDKVSIIATHFPCTCLSDDVCLILSCKQEKIEDVQDQENKIIHPKEKYAVFFIDKEGGVHTKSKELFRSSAVKQYKTLCVYGEKGMTIEEALKRDGRFIDDLDKFSLSDNENPNVCTVCTQRVDNLDLKSFKICLPLNKRKSDEKQQENKDASNNLQSRQKTKSVIDVVKQSGITVEKAVKRSQESSIDNTKEIYERLREQFPDLKKWMEERFPGDSFEDELTLRKENFGKIQQSFSEVHRMKNLYKMGESVCKVLVEGVRQGTGFVLFGNFILTNKHLFDNHLDEEKCQVDVNVWALFNYDDPEPHTNFNQFSCKKTLIDFNSELDYAILELDPEGENPKQGTNTKKIKVPPGLLKNFGPVPQDGEACIIGHPEGGVKKTDPTCIIEKGMREQAVNDHLHPHKDSVLIIQSIIQMLKAQGIERIMMDQNDAEKVVTYHTFMYHGSSGSPVFDAHGRVFGLHSAGYTYEFRQKKNHVIEYAHPLLTIFRKFVSNLKENGNKELFSRVEKEAKENEYLKEVMEAERADAEEPMETDGV